MSKLHIKKGDIVFVMSGNDAYNAKNPEQSKGRVLEVFPEKQKAIVEGMNIVSKHTKPSAKSPNGGIEKKEAPIHISNLMHVDPKTGKPTRIGRKEGDKGKLVRYAKKSGEEIK
ncbi:MAG: 50S ribosomal protein L24 [Dysgonamonadaceae bacterium]|jgi:large subunit ribosomal protein L24|nr:50S ribosomal protein L24 [Dysgonamonadaceae bacterium]